jgi:taurine transport system permease protein
MQARILTFLFPIILVSLWILTAEFSLVPELFIPHPVNVIRAFLEVSSQGYRGSTLLVHLGASLGRLGLGFLLAVVLGIPLGLFMGSVEPIKLFVTPVFEFYRPLPPLAYYSLLILWLGIGESSKIVLLFLAALPPLVMNTMAGVEAVPAQRLETAQTLGGSNKSLFYHVMFPSCLPHIFTGLRIALGFAYTTLISAEIVAAVNGIGWMVLDAGRFLRTDVLFMAVFVMGCTGMLLDRLIRGIETKVVHWKGR